MRIVIADDNLHTREGLRSLLATYPGWAIVGEAVDGRDAIQQVATLQPDAVVLDVHMPDVDGIQAASTIRARWPRIAIVILSIDALQWAAADAGADAFIGKAEGPTRLVAALYQVCGQGDTAISEEGGSPE